MLEFSDQPYRYFPPKNSWLFSRWILRHNRLMHLKRTQQIVGVDFHHADRVFADRQDGDRLLFLVNHPTHADAAIFLETLRQLRMRCQMMAAYDVFLRSRLTRFVMQRMGAFSVDRDGSDRRPMQQSLETLTRGRYPLAIFPEGNVYLTNDRVTPLMDGAAFTAVKAQEAVDKACGEAGGGRVRIVPVGIKSTHVTDARDAVAARLAALAQPLGQTVDLRADPLGALLAVGRAALVRSLEQRGLAVPDVGEATGVAELSSMAEAAADAVLDRLEPKLGLSSRAGSAAGERIRAARRAIHAVRSDPDRAVDHTAAATWADEAMLALRLASYAIGYVHEKPTLDRVSETVEKLEEDLLNRMPRPLAPRHARVHFGKPIDVAAWVAMGLKKRELLASLTSASESAIQALVDEANAANDRPGAKLF